MNAISSVVSILDQFYLLSDLIFNPSKCELFCSGVRMEDAAQIQNNYGFLLYLLRCVSMGALHTSLRKTACQVPRGPLITGKLTIHDCMPSLDKISSRIQHWATKLLFFAGRQQLVSSVIFSLQNYWCTIFILPSQVIKSIESKCNSFLWKGKDTSVVGAKVA